MPDKYSLLLSDGRYHEYQLKSSKRAKNIRINLTNTGILSVTLPQHLSVTKAHKFIHSKTAWIEKHLSNITIHSRDEIPNSLNLCLLNETWKIELILDNSKIITLLESENNSLVLKGNIEDKELVRRVINKWCQNKCKKLFSTMLASLAEAHGFHYNRLSIRSQKTRWGSCSGNKNISLNSKLLFMPEEVVKYVMVHELCHTIEMNHSSRFWKLVEECDPEYKHNIKALKEFANLIKI